MADKLARTVDANEAVAAVAYRLSEVAAIYPITPSSAMGELCDEWAAAGRSNLFGAVPRIVEMQSEGGAAGAVHGALQAGALAVTFTASQGLLLMIPSMFKLAGELQPFVMHVAARTVATHALSIFGDHSDVMACRSTGFAMLAASSVQEAQDLACIAHLATLQGRVPFVHFFDGFRTSHELAKIERLADEDLRALVDPAAIAAHRERAMTPERPTLRGTAQNPDAFFQAREACNRFYAELPGTVAAVMQQFAARTGRQYAAFDYHGDPAASDVVVVMGSAVHTVQRAVDELRRRPETARVGVVRVRLYRPFDVAAFAAVLPASVRRIAVLDRTKEPGAIGEPLYLDVVAALHQMARSQGADQGLAGLGAVQVYGGRYGLSGKEFTPAMALAVFAELRQPVPRPQFTVGIDDDVTGLSLPFDRGLCLPLPDCRQAVFYGLGADGTVSANKNSIKILGEAGAGHVQGYFVYDSKKSGAMTVSHLRFGGPRFEAPYLVEQADFVAVHQFGFLQRIDVLALLRPGGKLLLNAPLPVAQVWAQLPRPVQQRIRALGLEVHVIDAAAVAKLAGIGSRINTIMQVCFFALAEAMPMAEAMAQIQRAIAHSYGKAGADIVQKNLAAVEAALSMLQPLPLPAASFDHGAELPPPVAGEAPPFVQRVTAALLAGHGDLLPVSAFPVDGCWPTDTARYEKRGIASEVPLWDPAVCIQCNQCVLQCPHAAIRAKLHAEGAIDPAVLPSAAWQGKDFPGQRYTIQVAPDDCTGCGLCVQICPARDKQNPRHKAIDMEPLAPVRERERQRYAAFLALPEVDRAAIPKLDIKGSQFLQPLFEYSGACGGCGETPYLKLLTQLFGDRLLIANATGCSSIYGGNLPTTPYAKDAQGRGPAWANSLFEDNAEFGLGIKLGAEVLAQRAQKLLHVVAPLLEAEVLVAELLAPPAVRSEAWLVAQRARVAELRRRLLLLPQAEAQELLQLADALVPRSVWLVGGDGWAFDIGYGGLDHVLSLPHDLNVLVLDTEVYSNTGGQASKATPLGAAAKFAAYGKVSDKKDLGLMALHYGHVFVASVAIGAQPAHTVRVLQMAEQHPGPSLVIAYSPCIAHGYDLRFGPDQQKRAVQSGVWPLFHYDPAAVERGEPPLHVDVPAGRVPVAEYMRNEARFRMVERLDPAAFRRYAQGAQTAAARRVAMYQHMAALRLPKTAAVAPLAPEA